MTTENVRSEKDILIERLDKIGCFSNAAHVADFILEDRRRIVKPLVKVQERIKNRMHEDDVNGGYKDLYFALLETIKNSGVTP